MILKKAIRIAVAVSALAAGAAVCVVALAYALYAAVEPAVGPAWASAIVAGVAALLLIIGGLLMTRRDHAAPDRHLDHQHRDFTGRAMEIAREKPMIALAAVAAAGLVALKNPKITAALVGAFLAGRAPKK